LKNEKRDESGENDTGKKMGTYKGMINVFTEECRKDQQKQKHDHLERIFKTLNKINKQ